MCMCCIWSSNCHILLNTLLILLSSQLDSCQYCLLLIGTTKVISRYHYTILIPGIMLYQAGKIIIVYLASVKPEGNGKYTGLALYAMLNTAPALCIWKCTQVSITYISLFLLLIKRTIQIYWIKLSCFFSRKKRKKFGVL